MQNYSIFKRAIKHKVTNKKGEPQTKTTYHLYVQIKDPSTKKYGSPLSVEKLRERLGDKECYFTFLISQQVL